MEITSPTDEPTSSLCHCHKTKCSSVTVNTRWQLCSSAVSHVICSLSELPCQSWSPPPWTGLHLIILQLLTTPTPSAMLLQQNTERKRQHPLLLSHWPSCPILAKCKSPPPHLSSGLGNIHAGPTVSQAECVLVI